MSCFRHLESFTKDKYPKFLKDILVASGFDCEAALQTLSESIINEIEQEVTNNLNDYKTILENTIYAKIYEKPDDRNFKFLIGHKAILINIPKTIKDKEASLKKKKSLEKSNKKQIEKKSKKIDLNETDFIQLLSEKIISYYEKKQLADVSSYFFSIACIQEGLTEKKHSFEKNEANAQENVGASVRLRLKCPFCIKKIWCSYSKRLDFCNLTSHLNTHYLKLKEIQDLLVAKIAPSIDHHRGQRTEAETTASETQNDLPAKLQIRRHHPSVLDNVRNILNRSDNTKSRTKTKVIDKVIDLFHFASNVVSSFLVVLRSKKFLHFHIL